MTDLKHAIPYVLPFRLQSSYTPRSSCVCISNGYQKLGRAWPHPLEWGSCLTPKTRALPYMCYHAEFDRSTSNRVGITRGAHETRVRWGPAPLGQERAQPLTKSPPPRGLPCRISSQSVKRYQHRYEDPPDNVGSSRFERSFKATETDANRSGTMTSFL